MMRLVPGKKMWQYLRVDFNPQHPPQGRHSPLFMANNQTISIKDQMAVGDMVLPKLPLGRYQTGLHVSEWRIKDWSSTSPESLKRSSPGFECGGHKWQIHLFPLGLVKPREQIVPSPKTSVGLYLVHSDHCHHLQPWIVEADVVLALCNAVTPTLFVKHSYRHQFSDTTALAGSHEFRRLGDLVRSRRPGAAPIIVNGLADVVVYLRVSAAVQLCKPIRPLVLPSLSVGEQGANSPVEQELGKPINQSTPSSTGSPGSANAPAQPSGSSSARLTSDSGGAHRPHSPTGTTDSTKCMVSKVPVDLALPKIPPSASEEIQNNAYTEMAPDIPERVCPAPTSEFSSGQHDPVSGGDMEHEIPAQDLELHDSINENSPMLVDAEVPIMDPSEGTSCESPRASEDGALEDELEASDDEIMPQIEVEEDGESDEGSMHQPPVKRRRKYYDAMDVVLSKALADKKRSGLKIGQLERSLKDKDEEMKALREKYEVLTNEKNDFTAKLTEKGDECNRLREEIKEVTSRKDEVKNLILQFSSDLERTLGGYSTSLYFTP